MDHPNLTTAPVRMITYPSTYQACAFLIWWSTMRCLHLATEAPTTSSWSCNSKISVLTGPTPLPSGNIDQNQSNQDTAPSQSANCPNQSLQHYQHPLKVKFIQNLSFQDHHILPKWTVQNQSLKDHILPKWKLLKISSFMAIKPSHTENFKKSSYKMTTPSQSGNYTKSVLSGHQILSKWKWSTISPYMMTTSFLSYNCKNQSLKDPHQLPKLKLLKIPFKT